MRKRSHVLIMVKKLCECKDWWTSSQSEHSYVIPYGAAQQVEIRIPANLSENNQTSQITEDSESTSWAASYGGHICILTRKPSDTQFVLSS